MTVKKKWVVFDCEGDGLHPTKFYCLSYEDHDGNKSTITGYGEIITFFTQYEMYVGHNVRRWDIPQLRRVIGVELGTALVVDSLGTSWYLEPERRRHNLESYGEDFGVPKPPISDWHNLTQEEYEHRCETDVQINVRIWKDQIKKLQKIYKSDEVLGSFLRYLDFKMYSAHLAEVSGWKLDVERVKASIEKLQTERERKINALSASMPRVPVMSTYHPPKRLYNSDGELSVLGQRWKERLAEGGFPEGHDEPIDLIVRYDEPNPQSNDQVKDWLYSLGWRPRTLKVQRNKKTGDITEIPQVNLPNGGGLCESIQDLFEKEPALQNLDALGVIKHRLGILNGYLRDGHSRDDGTYLSACVAGLTNTLRFKHAEIVNLPKVEKPYGIDIRGPLVAPVGCELCGSDMASLEDRIKQHFIWPHDPEYVAELNRPDYDPHLDLAFLAGAITKEQLDGYATDKSIQAIVKPIRSIYKNGNYACQYGAGVSRLAITCACDEATARTVHKTYWKRNWAIKAIAKEQEIQTIDGQMWLLNPINGFWYSLRTEKDIFSTLVQGSAAYCFDKWLKIVLSDREQVTGQFHDEFILCVKKGFSSFNETTKTWEGPIVDWLLGTIQKVNDELKLNRELGISVQFGDCYADIH